MTCDPMDGAILARQLSPTTVEPPVLPKSYSRLDEKLPALDATINNHPTPRVWLLQLLLIVSTTLLPLAIGKLCIPLQWYAFRCWEVLIDYRPAGAADGPLYANQVLRKVEVGDLGVRSPYAVSKPVIWYTDGYGFRNRPSLARARYDVVIIGRSDVAGNTLTQEDILAEVLERQAGQAVYGYAPASLDDFLRDPRFLQAPPSVLVFVNTERGLYELAPLAGEETQRRSPPPSLAKRLYARFVPKPISAAVDRVGKKPWLSAHLYRLWTHQPNYPFVVDPTTGMLFFETTLRQDARYRDRFDLTQRAVETVKAYRDAVTQRGMRFIFMPVPDKETVYWDLVPLAARTQPTPPPFLPDLLERLEQAGVEIVDLAPTYRQTREAEGRWTYHFDDTHWNPLGVAIAAQLLAQRLQEAPQNRMLAQRESGG